MLNQKNEPWNAVEVATMSGARGLTHEPVHSRRRFWASTFLGFVVLMIAVILAVVSRRREDRGAREAADTEANTLPSVQTTAVERAASGGSLDIPGTTMPLTEAYLYSRASGYLQKRFVDIGDHVRAGQLLAVVSAPDLDEQVQQAQAAVEQTRSVLGQMQAQLNLATLTWNRWKVLVAKGVFSRQDGDTQEANYRVALANEQSSESNVRAADANLRRLRVMQQFERIAAPFDGIITARNVDVGALISAQGSGLGPSAIAAGGSEAAGLSNSAGASGGIDSASHPLTGESQGGQLFTEAETDRLRILVSVPEAYAVSIKAGQTAELHFDGLPHVSYTGRVTRTADSIDTNTRTMLTEVQVANPNGRLKTGMSVLVAFEGTSMERPLVVPGDAIVIRNDHDAVAVVRRGTVHFTPVTPGRDYGNVTQIVSGLQEGEVIALNVTDDVKEGARVNAVHATSIDDSQKPLGLPRAEERHYGPDSAGAKRSRPTHAGDAR